MVFASTRWPADEPCDAAGGIVYHATYLRYAERARTEMLRAVGIDLIRLRDDHGLVFVVRRGEIDYQRPARLDDMLAVAEPVLAHRILVNFHAESEGVDSTEVIRRVIKETES